MHSIIYSEEKELAVQRLTAQVKPRGGKMGNISDKGSGKRHAGRPVGTGMESEVFCFTSSCPSESIYDRGRRVLNDQSTKPLTCCRQPASVIATQGLVQFLCRHSSYSRREEGCGWAHGMGSHSSRLG